MTLLESGRARREVVEPQPPVPLRLVDYHRD
jgi:hypothetical protein